MNNQQRYRLRHQKIFICKVCSIEFKRFYLFTKGTFCSANCQGKFLKGKKLSEETKRKIGKGVKNSSKYRQGLKTRSYPANSGQFGRGRDINGKNHWNWKGGEYFRSKDSHAEKEWRRETYKRDNWTCVLCGYRSCKKGDINADHIKAWILYPKLRFEITNGRTLCIPCHKNTDTYGGRVWKMHALSAAV